MIGLDRIVGFDWDDGNSAKSVTKHQVNRAEAETVFFSDPLIIVEDTRHSEGERRFNALGMTHQNRPLHIPFTLRQNETLIRVISACDMNRKERRIYEQS